MKSLKGVRKKFIVYVIRVPWTFIQVMLFFLKKVNINLYLFFSLFLGLPEKTFAYMNVSTTDDQLQKCKLGVF